VLKQKAMVLFNPFMLFMVTSCCVEYWFIWDTTRFLFWQFSAPLREMALHGWGQVLRSCTHFYPIQIDITDALQDLILDARASQSLETMLV